MEICIRYGGQWHCHYIPILYYPVDWGIPGPGPVNYPLLFQDAIVLASAQKAVTNISDATVRGAVEKGIATAFEAMQKHAGADVKVGGLEAR